MIADIVRIIPAYAGSTRSTRRPAQAGEDHPRIRGEHDCSIYFTNFPAGSSPHTRGARHECELPDRHFRIIPAYAGSTCRVRRRIGRRWDHPRIRGEHPTIGMAKLSQSGSSPHTRGAPFLCSVTPMWGGIIPAYAGSTK